MGAVGTTRVLVVGRGAPERGGIPTFLGTLVVADLGPRFSLDLLNLGQEALRDGGRASAGNVRRSLRDARRVAAATRRGDVVHLNTAFAPTVTALRAALLVLAARLRGGRVVVHVHGGRVALWMTTPRLRRLVRSCLRPAHVVVAVSQPVHDALVAACGAERTVLIDNAVDTEAFTGPSGSGGHRRVLYAGGLTPRKGVVDLLDASRALHAEGLEHELWLVGGTPDEGHEQEREVRAAAGPNVVFLGPRPSEEMPDLYRQADVFCLPSWYEAMPLSVLEAMATGLPVVATTVGDVPRLVHDGVHGRLVPPKDPAALAAALRDVLRDPPVAAAMGEAGRRTAEESFSLDRLVRDLQDLYTRTLEPRS